MTNLVFRLRNVPDEEAEAIRTLLTQNNIEWYETTAGTWGIAMPGIWVVDKQQITVARKLIDDYQIKLSSEQREKYRQQKLLGENPTLIQRILESPASTLGIVAFCVFILYASIHPFMKLAGFSQ